MEIGGAKFDIDVSEDISGSGQTKPLSLTVVIFGITSMATVRRIWEDTSSFLREINPELEEEVPTGKTLRTGPPSAPSDDPNNEDPKGEMRREVEGAKFNIGVMAGTPTADGEENHVLKVVVFGMDTIETVEVVSENISGILCAIDPKLELRDARGEGPTIN